MPWNFNPHLLGPDNPLYLKAGYGMGGQRPQDVVGDKVTFRRETDPYSMYKFPNDPTMWDEAIWDAKIGRGLKNGFEISQKYHDLEWADIAEDFKREDLRRKLTKGQPGVFSTNEDLEMLNQILDAMMAGNYGGENAK